MTYAWIAVALATAIRLYGGAQSGTAAVAAVLAVAALILTRQAAARIAAVFLLDALTFRTPLYRP